MFHSCNDLRIFQVMRTPNRSIKPGTAALLKLKLISLCYLKTCNFNYNFYIYFSFYADVRCWTSSCLDVAFERVRMQFERDLNAFIGYRENHSQQSFSPRSPGLCKCPLWAEIIEGMTDALLIITQSEGSKTILKNGQQIRLWNCWIRCFC